jgi:hypothetical protein
MNILDLISLLDSEIAALERARGLLAGTTKRKLAEKSAAPGSGARRKMSAEARARIGAATKARWAAGKQGKQSLDRLRRLGAKKAA